MIGAFTATASSGWLWRDGITAMDPARLELPPAVLCHVDHSLDAAAAGPFGIAVPILVGDRLLVEVVLASHAVEASDLLRSGRVPAVSIYADNCYLAPDPEPLRPNRHELLRGILTAVDLAERPMDPHSLIERVTYVNGLSEGHRQVRAAFDAYLADPRNPCQIDFNAGLQHHGAAVFAPLAAVVVGLRSEMRRIRAAEERRQLRGLLSRFAT